MKRVHFFSRSPARLFAACLALSLIMLLAHRMANGNLLGGAEPLRAEQAFVPSLLSSDENRLQIGFEIAEGYYLYRDKTRFTFEASGDTTLSELRGGSTPSLGEPAWTEAEITSDDFFGEQAIFRGEARATLPWSGPHDGSTRTLSISFQGCADFGLCYPPTTVSLEVTLPAKVGTAEPVRESPITGKQQALASTSSSLGGLFDDGDGSDELLPPELAYLPQLVSANDRQIVVRWHIEPGYYLYRDKLVFSVSDAGGASVSARDLDPGIEQYDDFFGNVRIFRDMAEARLYLDPAVDLAAASQATLHIDYQGCADIGVCFPPSQVSLPLVFDATPSGLPAVTAATDGTGGSVAGNSPASGTEQDRPDSAGLSFETAASTASATGIGTSAASNTAPDVPSQSEQDRLSSLLGASSLWLTVATFFGLGLLLAFTPCVLPMVPILSSLIVGQGEAMSTGKAFRLSLVYVLVMASTYALVGVAVGLTGYNVQAFLQNPWVLSLIALLFVLLSLAMFGFYELQMPTTLQDRLTRWSNRQRGGQVTGVALMGFISTLIVGPCVTAPLAGALIYIARTGDALIGGAALFALGLGMGAPLLLIGTSAGRLLPRAGAWMTVTKQFFGILLLGMAIYMLSRFLPVTISMALFGTLAIMSAIYLGATDSIDRSSGAWQRFGKGAGIIVGLYGVALLLGALSGTASYRTPLRGIVGNTGAPAQAAHLTFAPVKTVVGLQQVVDQASASGRPVMLDFYADWCISCKEMEAFTFVDARVQSLLQDAVLVQADVTANDADDQALLKQFDLFGPPGIIFYDTDGVEIPAARVVGFMNAERFADHLARFIGS